MAGATLLELQMAEGELRTVLDSQRRTAEVVLNPKSPPTTTSRWTAWTTPDRQSGVGSPIGTVILVSPEPFRQIGHSLFTLLIAALAGMYAKHVFDNQAVPTENSRLMT